MTSRAEADPCTRAPYRAGRLPLSPANPAPDRYRRPPSSRSGFRAHAACARPTAVFCVPVDAFAIFEFGAPTVRQGSHMRCFERRTARHAAKPPLITLSVPRSKSPYCHLRSYTPFSLPSCLLLRIAGRSTVMHRSAGMPSSPSWARSLPPLRSSRRVG